MHACVCARVCVGGWVGGLSAGHDCKILLQGHNVFKTSEQCFCQENVSRRFYENPSDYLQVAELNKKGLFFHFTVISSSFPQSCYILEECLNS